MELSVKKYLWTAAPISEGPWSTIFNISSLNAFKYNKNIFKKFISEMLRKQINFSLAFYLIKYLAHAITKDLCKNSNFENIRAGFLLRCQNSLWQTTLEFK